MASNEYHFIAEESRPPPEMRTYDEYLANPNIYESAKKSNNKKKPSAQNGVKGRMKFCDLDYAECIHWTKDPMHTVTNIISNSIHLFNKLKNRTEKTSVREECKKQQIHEHLWRGTLFAGETTAKWIFEKEQIQQINEDMKKLKVGSGFSLLMENGGEYSSDKLEFATKYARSVIKNNYGDPKVTENTLQLFDFIKYLFQKTFQKHEIDKNIQNLYSILSDREGFLPNSECTYALHEIIHISHQIKIVGPPLLCNMFKFER